LTRFVLRSGAGRLAAALVSALVMASTSPGCGSSGPELARVSGTVTYEGKPVPLGTVAFVNKDPNGRNATGAIQSDGSYTLQTEAPGDGAQVGEYAVTISAVDAPVLDYKPTKPVESKRYVPEKYEKPETSGLTATVKSGSNTIPFDLK